MSNVVWNPADGWIDGPEVDNAEILASLTGKPVEPAEPAERSK